MFSRKKEEIIQDVLTVVESSVVLLSYRSLGFLGKRKTKLCRTFISALS